jgi:hypothetical protein
MISIQEFRSRCRQDNAETIVHDVILSNEAAHVSQDNREFLKDGICSKFGIQSNELQLWIVGSAKLGFSITNKKKSGILFPRYRLFSGTSDIDVAIVSASLFRLIWDDLCLYAHGQPWWPWDSKLLGDYMVYGWMRPDCFPKVRRCDDWWNQFRVFSVNPRYNRRKVSGGLFHTITDLQRYQRRAVDECINFEKMK